MTLQERIDNRKHITFKEWKQITDSICNDKLYHVVFDLFCEYYNVHRNFMSFAEDAAFRQLGYKLQVRYDSFKAENNNKGSKDEK
jgi:hypothetical protein